jgi:hypothetical protein
VASSSIDARLPGADLVASGLADLARGELTVEALLIAAAAPRLRRVGLEVPDAGVAAPLHRVYDLLAADANAGADAHSRYNALIARVVSFARAAEHAASG